MAETNTCPEFPYFGAKYPDARCVNGTLHDMDNCDEDGNLYITHENHPCPFCNKEDFMKNMADNEIDVKQAEKWISDILNRYG